MTEKTPMNELIEWCDSFKNPQFQPTPLNLKEKILTLLPKERQNLIDAHAEGQLVEEQHTIPQRRINKAEQYVKEKFNI